jgi:prepilin-type N-terminal cleavage/methylation domain-containing protein
MRGHTLIELLFVLLLFGITAAAVTPAAREYRDRAAVIAAREAVIGLLAQARLSAIERGGARVQIVPAGGRAESIVGDSVMRSIRLRGDFGVDVRSGGAADTVDIRYDALGLGRVASQTVDLARGDEVAELVVSSFGRVTRR